MKRFLYDKASELEINLDDFQLEQFIEYYNLLIDRNKVMNLTGITDYREVVIKHFIDSLCLIKLSCKNIELRCNSYSVIDIGTGAGFPGIPLKIAFPNLKITLLDSLNKRVNFLEDVINRLNLTDIVAIHGRAEDYAKINEYREKFDFAVSRAVANLSTLCEYTLPFVKVGGYFISYKSEKAEEEINLSIDAVKILGGCFIDKIDYCIEGNSRNLIVIEKTDLTPSKYPRKSGIPLKKPL